MKMKQSGGNKAPSMGGVQHGLPCLPLETRSSGGEDQWVDRTPTLSLFVLLEQRWCIKGINTSQAQVAS